MTDIAPVLARLRPNIRGLKAYSSARDEYTGQEAILLDANENPFVSAVNRYPDPHQRALKATLAAYKGGLAPEQIFLGNGSDEAIDLLLRAFCEPGKDAIIVPDPSYGMYRVSADTQGAAVTAVRLRAEDFQPDVAAFQAQFSEATKSLSVRLPW